MNKKYLIFALLSRGILGFAAESTSQQLTIQVNALENIFITQSNVNMIARYDPTSGSSDGSGAPPQLIATAGRETAGDLIVYSTTPANVTVSFVALSGSGFESEWASGDILDISYEGRLGAVNLYSGSTAKTDQSFIIGEDDGAVMYHLIYGFRTPNIGKGQGTMNGIVTFTATAT